MGRDACSFASTADGLCAFCSRASCRQSKTGQQRPAALSELQTAAHLGVATPREQAAALGPNHTPETQPLARSTSHRSGNSARAADAAAHAPFSPARNSSGTLSQPPAEATRWQVLKAAAAVAPQWFVAQLCFNYALSMTSVTSNTILSSPASLFTFFLSVLLLGETFTVSKLVAVVLTVLGAHFAASSHSVAGIECHCLG